MLGRTACEALVDLFWVVWLLALDFILILWIHCCVCVCTCVGVCVCLDVWQPCCVEHTHMTLHIYYSYKPCAVFKIFSFQIVLGYRLFTVAFCYHRHGFAEFCLHHK